MGDYTQFIRVADEFLRAHVPSLETDFGLPVGFIGRLTNEDDWSFVIKGHALVEVAITELVSARVGHPELAATFAATPLLGRAGKLQMAESLGLIEKPVTTFVRRLSELRNALVHDVTRVTFAFPAYLQTLDDNGRRSLESALIYLRPDAAIGPLPPSSYAHFKTFVWFNLSVIMIMLSSRRSIAEKNKMIMALEAQIGRSIGKQPAP